MLQTSPLFISFMQPRIIHLYNCLTLLLVDSYLMLLYSLNDQALFVNGLFMVLPNIHMRRKQHSITAGQHAPLHQDNTRHYIRTLCAISA